MKNTPQSAEPLGTSGQDQPKNASCFSRWILVLGSNSPVRWPSRDIHSDFNGQWQCFGERFRGWQERWPPCC